MLLNDYKSLDNQIETKKYEVEEQRITINNLQKSLNRQLEEQEQLQLLRA